MPSCPECGYDVEEPGLCPECRKERERRDAGGSAPLSGAAARLTPRRSEDKRAHSRSTARRLRITVIVLLMAVAAEAGFILGREISRNPQTRDTNVGPMVTLTDNPGPEPRPPVDADPEEIEASEIAELPAAFDLNENALEPPLEEKEDFVQWTLRNRPEEEYYVSWRWDCSQDLLSWDSIQDDRILRAFLMSPREKFIRERNAHLAYEHRYLPIGYGATITDPWVVTIMTQTINPDVDHRVLEIGTGSGYQAAILSQLSNHIFSIEIIEELFEETDAIYSSMERDYPEYANIRRKAGDGYYGWPEFAPFDRIIVTCGIDHIPPDLLKQLAPGGTMVIPVGPPSGQTLMKVVKRVDRDGTVFFDREKIMSVKFIPFITKEGDTRVRGTP